MSVWPFRPNWGEPYVERFAHLTEILTTESGREQRRSMRTAARHTVEYRTMAAGAEMQALLRSLVTRFDPIVFPDEVRRVSPSVNAVSGATSVTLAAVPVWMIEGRDVVFEDTGTRERVLRTIYDITGTVVTFEDAAARAWSTMTRIMPALTGQLDPKITASLRTDQLARTRVSLMVDPGSDIEIAGAAATTFNGREVLTLSPDWGTEPEFEFEDPTEWFDGETGPRSAVRTVDFVTILRRQRYMIFSAAQADALIGLFLRMKGRRGEFYQPSGRNDFTLMQATTSGTNTWRVAGHEFAEAYAGDTVHRAFEVRLRSGAVHRFLISGITTGGTTTPYSQIQTTSNAALTINPADVLMISWLPCVRFATDEIEVTWKTDTIAEVTLNTQTLEDLP